MDYFLLTTLIMLNVAYVAVFALAGKATGTDSFDGMTTTVDRGRLSGRSASNIFAPVAFYPHRSLELTEGQCWSTRDDRKPNRYCIFDDTPRNGAFLSLSCPTTSDDLTQCGCTIGIGDSGDAPNTDTCGKCGFCIDGSLAYDCRNVAEGTCIGRYVFVSFTWI
eukprot:scaffold5529_cov117-Cylindrotheca_fusiformis.AAC.27